MLRFFDIIRRCFKVLADAVDHRLDRIEHRLFGPKLIKKREDRNVPLKETIKVSMDEIDRRYKKKETVTGISTGFKSLDLMSDGLKGSEFIVQLPIT